MFFVVLCLMAFGLSQVFKYAKNNPGNTIQATSIFKRWFQN